MAIDPSTKLLLHLNGADGATSTTDVSPSGHTITFAGTAQLDTAQKKWGNASLLLDGDSDYLSLADSADWDISTNFTIDLWVRHTDYTGNEGYVCQYVDLNNYWSLYHVGGSGMIFVIRESGGYLVDTGFGGEITDSNWHHVAMCKVANEYGVYLDGIQRSYKSDADITTYAGSLYIGVTGVAGALDQYFDGHMDEVRINHSNIFSASPNATPDDTITVPTRQYGLLTQAIFLE